MNPDSRFPGDALLDEHEDKLDRLLEWCGEMEGEIKQMRGDIRLLQDIAVQLSLLELDRYPG